MTRWMQHGRMAIIAAWGIAGTGCLEVAGDAAQDGVAAQAVASNREVRLREIYASVLEEGGDEIYLTASQAGSTSHNVIRPAGTPDYWRFDDPDMAHFMNLHVGTIVPGGLLIVNLWEQDGGPHDEIGTIDFQLTSSGAVDPVDTPTGHFVGIEQGRFAVRFTNGARYKVWFDILP